MKYSSDLNVDVTVKGVSIGIDPIRVRYIKLFDHKKNLILKTVLLLRLLILVLVNFVRGSALKIKIEEIKARTPPSLLGIVRKIA